MSELSVLKNHLKTLRKSHGRYTQEMLANEVGCTRQTIIALEKNLYNPSLILALRIAMVLGVAVEDVFELVDENDA